MTYPQLAGEYPVENSEESCGNLSPTRVKREWKKGVNPFPDMFSTAHLGIPQLFHRRFHSRLAKTRPGSRSFPQVKRYLYNKDRGYV
jgi:hypothetical protein